MKQPIHKVYIDGPDNEDWIKAHGQEEDIKASEIAARIHQQEINAKRGDDRAGEIPVTNLPKGRS